MNNNTPKFISVTSGSEVIKVDELNFIEWNTGHAPVYYKNFQWHYIDEDTDLHETLTTWSSLDLVWGNDEITADLKQYIINQAGNGFDYWYYAEVRTSGGKAYPLPLLFEDQSMSDLGEVETLRLRKEVLDWAKSE